MSSLFRGALENLLNQHSMENGSNTPDFVLATYLRNCLDAFDWAVNQRDLWYGRPETVGKNLAERVTKT